MVAYLLGPDSEIPEGMKVFAIFNIAIADKSETLDIVKRNDCKVVGDSHSDLEEKIIESIRNCFKKHKEEFG